MTGSCWPCMCPVVLALQPLRPQDPLSKCILPLFSCRPARLVFLACRSSSRLFFAHLYGLSLKDSIPAALSSPHPHLISLPHTANNPPSPSSPSPLPHPHTPRQDVYYTALHHAIVYTADGDAENSTFVLFVLFTDSRLTFHPVLLPHKTTQYLHDPRLGRRPIF